MTSLMYLLYCLDPNSAVRTVFTTDSSVQLRVSSTTSSGQSYKNGFGYCANKTLHIGREIPLRRQSLLVVFSILVYDEAEASLDCSKQCANPLTLPSGPATNHLLIDATGFSVSPMIPPEPFKIALFCSCAWSIGMLENLFEVLWITQHSLNFSWIESGRFSMSLICNWSHISGVNLYGWGRRTKEQAPVGPQCEVWNYNC